MSVKNPALVLFVVDVSKSMRESKQLEHIFSTIPSLQSIALSKPGHIRFAVIGFGIEATLLFDDPLEDAQSKFEISEQFDERTNLKAAAKMAKEVYDRHVDDYCKSKNPLASVLFFTDGDHTPTVDLTHDEYGYPKKNKWHKQSVDEHLDLGENVIRGLIDYGSKSSVENFPKGIHSSKNKLTDLTRLDEDMVSKAYARDITHPEPEGHSLVEVLGPQKNLVGKLFVVSSKTVSKSPSVTGAFVRLGTFSSTKSESGSKDTPKSGVDWDDEL